MFLIIKYFKSLERVKSLKRVINVFILTLCLVNATRAAYGVQQQKVLVFSDGGLDDIAALALILKDPKIKVIGVVAEPNGVTQPLEQALRNLVATAILLGNYNYPIFSYSLPQAKYSNIFPEQAYIYEGLDHNLEGKIYIKMHEYSNTERTLLKIFRSNNNIALLELGPASVGYDFFQEHPQLIKKIKHMVISGGAFNIDGNISPANKAEWNIYQDPKAIQYILDQHIPKTFIPLDISNKIIFYTPISKINTRFGKLFIKNWYIQKSKYPDMAIFDLAAASYLIKPNLFTCPNVKVGVILESSIYYAKTYTISGKGKQNSKICLDLQLNQIISLFTKQLLF